MRHRLPDWELTPIRITGIYLFLGFSALIVSDALFPHYLQDPILSQVQSLKGGVEVLTTAGLILLLTSRRDTQLKQDQQNLNHQRQELEVLHRVLRHNIRNDINVIQLKAQAIHDQLPEDQTEECAKILDKIDVRV